MPLNADVLLDRERLKSLATRWKLVAIIAIVAAVLVSIQHSAKLPGVQRDHIARLKVEGVITDDPRRTDLIEKIARDKRIKAVIVWLDTPGGSAVGGEQLYRDLRDLSKTKPTVSVMRDVAASAGYLTALGTDRIYAMEGTITGSIGVLLQLAEVTELAKKLGITPITVKSGPFKGSPSPFEPFTPAERQVAQISIQYFYDYFVGLVAERRNLPPSRARELSDGRIYSGRQAAELKLIDAIGGEDEARAWLEKEKGIKAALPIENVEVEEDAEGLLKRLSGAASEKLLNPMLLGLDGLVSIWQPNAL